MFQQRKALLESLESEFGFKAILYVTGDRPNAAAQIYDDVLPIFLEHLDHLGKVEHLGLVLYSRGGVVTAGWSIVNLLRQFCKRLTVVVPYRAQSTATLMCLGADSVVMTKQAILGPIDPSTNGPFNPIPQGLTDKTALSVEDLASYFEMAKELKLNKSGLADAMMKLSEYVNPVAIGNVFRARNQIRNLASKLMKQHNGISYFKRKKIISVLCEDAGSHDYTIHRKEAISLGMNITKPNDSQYRLIKKLHEDFESEMELRIPFTLPTLAPGGTAQIQHKLALVESPGLGSNEYVQSSLITSDPANPAQIMQNFLVSGWRRANVP